MKMAAAAGNGDDEQDRTKESIAQDSADGNDSYFFESLIFSGLLWMQPRTEPPSSEGATDGVRRLSSCMPTTRTTMGVLIPKHYMFRRGCVWKCEHVRWTPCRFFQLGDASGAEG